MFVILWNKPKFGPVFASSLGGWQAWAGEGILSFKSWREAKDYLTVNPFPADARIVEV